MQWKCIWEIAIDVDKCGLKYRHRIQNCMLTVWTIPVKCTIRNECNYSLWILNLLPVKYKVEFSISKFSLSWNFLCLRQFFSCFLWFTFQLTFIVFLFLIYVMLWNWCFVLWENVWNHFRFSSHQMPIMWYIWIEFWIWTGQGTF